MGIIKRKKVVAGILIFSSLRSKWKYFHTECSEVVMEILGVINFLKIE